MGDLEIQTEEFCEGKLLIATPSLHSSCFEKSVIYICVHNEDGAMGIIVNHLLSELSLSSILQQFNLPDSESSEDCPVFFGGPVETQQGFILHTNDYNSSESLAVNDSVSLSSNAKILSDISNNVGPESYILTFGYSGWDAGQLEDEIKQGSWYTVDANEDIIFGKDNEKKWLLAANLAGINDPYYFSSEVGHA